MLFSIRRTTSVQLFRPEKGNCSQTSPKRQPWLEPRHFQSSRLHRCRERWLPDVLCKILLWSQIALQTRFVAWFIPLCALSITGVPKTSRPQGSGNPNVERTFSLPSNPTPPGSFLLPSYPLATLPGVQLTPTLSRRCHADSSLSMSNTWPNNRELSPRHREPSPWRNNNGVDIIGNSYFDKCLKYHSVKVSVYCRSY